MNTTTTNRHNTDSLKTLARRHNSKPSVIRDIAHDIDVPVRYIMNRHTWVIDADAAVISMFNQHIADLLDN